VDDRVVVREVGPDPRGGDADAVDAEELDQPLIGVVERAHGQLERRELARGEVAGQRRVARSGRSVRLDQELAAGGVRDDDDRPPSAQLLEVVRRRGAREVVGDVVPKYRVGL
jgi:hypothetical protein